MTYANPPVIPSLTELRLIIRHRHGTLAGFDRSRRVGAGVAEVGIGSVIRGPMHARLQRLDAWTFQQFCFEPMR